MPQAKNARTATIAIRITTRSVRIADPLLFCSAMRVVSRGSENADTISPYFQSLTVRMAYRCCDSLVVFRKSRGDAAKRFHGGREDPDFIFVQGQTSQGRPQPGGPRLQQLRGR